MSNDKATEAAENEEIRTLLRARLLAMLRDSESTLRGSTIAQIVAYLRDLDKLKAKEEPPSPAEQISSVAGRLPFPTSDEDFSEYGPPDQQKVRTYPGGRFSGPDA